MGGRENKKEGSEMKRVEKTGWRMNVVNLRGWGVREK